MDPQHIQALYDNAVEAMADAAEPWQGDTINDQLARAVIGSMRPIADALYACINSENINPYLFQIAATQYVIALENVRKIRHLGELRKS